MNATFLTEFIILQDYMYSNIAELIDYHMVNRPHCRLGEVIVNLGRTETFLLRSARRQPGTAAEYILIVSVIDRIRWI